MIPQHYKKNIEAKVFFENLNKDFMQDKSFKHDDLSLEDKNELHHYVVELFNLHKKKYYKNRDFEEFDISYKKLKSLYNSLISWTILYDYINILIEDGQFENAYNEWTSIGSWGDSSIEMLIVFERAFNKSMVNGKHIYKIASKKNQLTDFGMRNLEDVFDIISSNIQTLHEYSFFEVFYKDYSSFKPKKTTYPFEHYKQFFQHSESSKKLWELHSSDQSLKKLKGKMYNGNASQDFVIIAIKEECSRLLREAENSYRNSIGAKNIGESWISETELFYKLKNYFIKHDVVQHGRPEWLGRQHVDIWFPNHKIGIEYQGQQHDRPIEFFGGEKSFEENKKRDERKRKLFQENNATLIEVREGFDFDALCEEIKAFVKN